MFKLAFRHGGSPDELPGKPAPSNPDDGDGDVFDYAHGSMKIEGELVDRQPGEKLPSNAGLGDMLSSFWDTGFSDPAKWVDDDSGSGDSGSGDSDDHGHGFEGKLSDLQKRCDALAKASGASSPDSDKTIAAQKAKSAFAQKQKDKKGKEEAAEDDGPPSKTHMVLVLVAVLAILFFMLLVADVGFHWFYDHVQNREYTCLKLKVVLDSAARELAVLTFVVVVGYMLLWSGSIAHIEEDWLGYSHSEGHLLTTLFGDVHFLLASAMLAFMAITFVLVLFGEHSCQAWARQEIRAEAPNIVIWDYALSYMRAAGRRSGWCGGGGCGPETHASAMDFLTLRMQFAPLLWRQGGDTSAAARTGCFAPRKQNCDGTTSRFAHFDFAEYLSVRLSRELAKILKVSMKSWVVLEVFMLLLTLPLLSTWKVQVYCFVGFGYGVLALHLLVRAKLAQIWYVLVEQTPAQVQIRRFADDKLGDPDSFVEPSEETKGQARVLSAEMVNVMQIFSVRPSPGKSRHDAAALFWRNCCACGCDGDARFEGARLLQSLVRLVVMCTAICIILVGLSATIALDNWGYAGMIATLAVGAFPVVVIMIQLKQLIERFVILTSIECFERPRVVQTVIDDNRQRFGAAVAYLVDWIVLASTQHALQGSQGTTDHCELTPAKVDDTLMQQFWEQVRDDNGTVSKQVFVRWYQRLKLRCAKSRIPAAAIGKVYDQVAPSGELDKEGFSKIIQYRDQIDYEITNELIDTAGALNHIRSLLHGKGDAKEWVTIGKLKTRIQSLLGINLDHDGVTHFIVPVFKEAGFFFERQEDTPEQLETRRAGLQELVHLIRKYAPQLPGQ